MRQTSTSPNRRNAPLARAAARACALAALLGAAIALPPTQSMAQESRAVGVLTGVVRDSSGERLVGAELVVANSRARSFSNDTGGFRVLGVPAGEGTLRVRRLGYAPRTVDISIAAGASTHQEIVLERVPLSVDAVVVSAEARPVYSGWAAKFYQRMERGQGRFITREDIDRRNAFRVTDLLRSLPGVTIRSSRVASNTVFLRGQRCTPFIWIDNTPAMAGYVDVDNFQPSSLEGIEVYQTAASVPAELSVPRDRMACGMIVLWSRMPERPTRGASSSRYSAGDLAALVSSLKVYTADQVDSKARLESVESFRPAYPTALRALETTGSVLAEFVVDSAGRVEMDTFGVVTPARTEFIEAVRAALPRARFIPATIDGRPVRQLVHLPVRFDV